MHVRLLLLILLVLPVSLLSAAQAPPDSTPVPKKDSTRTAFFYKDFEKDGRIRLHPGDTILFGVQRYDPLFHPDHFSASLGNIGQNYRLLIPDFVSGSSGFDYGIHSADRYLFKNDSVRYYRVLKDYSLLEYCQGAKKEVFFHTVYSRNFFKGLNIGFDFRVMNAPGAYLRQKTNHINFYVTAHYFTRNKRYGVIANYLVNRLKNYQNGGIASDSLFEQNLESNRQIIPVNLNNALNRIRETGIFMKHYFNLSRHKAAPDDSSHYFELGRLAYSFEYNRQIQNYLDDISDSLFYPEIYLDSLETRDSLTVKVIRNELTWTNPSFDAAGKARVIQLAAHLRQQYTEFSDHAGKKFFIQYIPAAEFFFTPYEGLRLEARGDYVFGDYNEGDRFLDVRVRFTLGKKDRNIGELIAKGVYAARKPGLFYSYYSGNNFRWDTSWQQQTVFGGGGSYRYKDKLEAGVTLSRINHFVYLNESALPWQHNSEFGYFNAYLQGRLDLWRLTLRGKMVYQTVQGTDVLRLPTFLADADLYLTQPLFHGAAIFQPGIHFLYNTAYYSDQYMPATRSFYLQRAEETGNYPYLDVYINVKIQRLRAFVMYKHINAGISGRRYYDVPGYPTPDAAFHFGFSWRFFD